MYFKLIKCTPGGFGPTLKKELAVATRENLLAGHLRLHLKRERSQEYLTFEQEFGYTSKRPETEPWYEVEQMDGMLMFDMRDI